MWFLIHFIKHLIDLACNVGYSGKNCDTKCVFPSFGKDCKSTCNCKEINCDHAEGCKNSTGKTLSNICDGYVLCFHSICLLFLWENLLETDFLKVNIFKLIILVNPRCSVNGKSCCFGFKWDRVKQSCKRKC